MMKVFFVLTMLAANRAPVEDRHEMSFEACVAEVRAHHDRVLSGRLRQKVTTRAGCEFQFPPLKEAGVP